ncbi:hypothetical protein, conserved [Eimeria necatrix]|uniref:ELM2 domain-containing protein n=1 Tax=Eimeria necatrix TaxID=51315 RepID=U6MPJ4_9EIME|nr:hypothetical protein, conserved [Eimeria necatrix]CDJ65008.1 hypothetical protein, conserved [Eimeria necatrix]
MGIVSCPSDSADSTAAAAVETGPAAASTAAETANTSVPSGATDFDLTEGSVQRHASDDEQQNSTYGNSGREQQQPLAPVSADSPDTFTYECATGGEEQQQQQQQQQPLHQRTRNTDCHEDATSPCAECGKDQPNTSSFRERGSGKCDTCSSNTTINSKPQQRNMPDEVQEAEALAESHQVGSYAASAALEDNGTNQGRDGPTEAADDAAARASGTARSSSSSGCGASTGSGRARGTAGAVHTATAAATATAVTATTTGSRKCTDEGSVRRHEVPVGPRHQVPCLPPFFLEAGGFGCCCCDPTPTLDPSLTAKLVYSPSSLERVRQRRLAEGLADRAICSEGDMEAYMQQCAKNWKGNKPGWQPFSPEFAFKLLHYAGYDPSKALQLMEDPQFSFQLVCDGPVRRYDNKWRPKDRRGVISPTPYPPPVFLRGYLSRRHYRDSTGYSLR